MKEKYAQIAMFTVFTHEVIIFHLFLCLAPGIQRLLIDCNDPEFEGILVATAAAVIKSHVVMIINQTFNLAMPL